MKSSLEQEDGSQWIKVLPVLFRLKRKLEKEKWKQWDQEVSSSRQGFRGIVRPISVVVTTSVPYGSRTPRQTGRGHGTEGTSPHSEAKRQVSARALDSADWTHLLWS